MGKRLDKQKRKRRFGDRKDGRLLRSLDPITKLSPYIMTQRNDASNSFSYAVDLESIEQYVREKRAQGLKGFSSMHVLLAAYVRTTSQRPALNRFVSGQRIYARNYFEAMMTIKKEMKLDSEDSVICMQIPLNATAKDVYEISERVIQETRNETTGFDSLTKTLDYIPGFVKRLTFWLIRALDYYDLLPMSLLHLSPFHASLYMTSIASLGLPPVFHHIYNIGNVPMFVAMGVPEWKPVGKGDGSVEVRKMMPLTMMMDERICDGYYFASAFRMFVGFLRNPWQLDEAPAEIMEDVD